MSPMQIRIELGARETERNRRLGFKEKEIKWFIRHPSVGDEPLKGHVTLRQLYRRFGGEDIEEDAWMHDDDGNGETIASEAHAHGIPHYDSDAHEAAQHRRNSHPASVEHRTKAEHERERKITPWRHGWIEETMTSRTFKYYYVHVHVEP